MASFGRAGVFACLVICCALAGCSGQASTQQPEAKERLTKLFQLYKYYCEKNKKGPPTEQALRDFAQKLTPEERASRLIGDDLDGIFTSPRDGQKFVIKFNQMISAGAGSKGVAWEATGKDGRRFVALMMGYVEEYGEAMFQESTK